MYGYIYKTTNLVNGKIYIGKKKGEFTTSYKGSGKYLKNALNKYGVENFSVEVIEYCETLHIQNEREKYWIKYYRDLDVDMYNIASGGDGGDLVTCLPCEDYDKFVKHISELNKMGIIGNKNKHLSSTHKQRIGGANRGKVHSQEWIDKQRQKVIGMTPWNKGLDASDERVQKHIHKKGEFHHTEETKLKISKALSGRKLNVKNRDKWIMNLSESHKGKHFSEEHKYKLRQAAIGRIWIHNATESKMIYPEELEKYLKLDYQKGRGKTK